MSAEPVLPELPQEVDAVWVMVRGEKDLAEAQDYYFTADQVRAYGLACLKAGREQGLREAAQKCETRGKTGRYKARRVEALDLAFEIRSMAEGSATRSGCEENP